MTLWLMNLEYFRCEYIVWIKMCGISMKSTLFAYQTWKIPVYINNLKLSVTHMPLRDSLPGGFDYNDSAFVFLFFHSKIQQSHTRKVGHVRIVEMNCNCRIYFTSGQKRVILQFCSELLNEDTHTMMLLFFLSLSDMSWLYWPKNLLPS